MYRSKSEIAVLDIILLIGLCSTLVRASVYELGTNPGSTVCFHELGLPHHVMTYSFSPFIFGTVAEFMKLPQAQNSGLIEAYQKALNDRKDPDSENDQSEGSTRRSKKSNKKQSSRGPSSTKLNKKPPGGRGRVLQSLPKRTSPNSPPKSTKRRRSNSNSDGDGRSPSGASQSGKASEEYYAGEEDRLTDPEEEERMEAANRQWQLLEAELEAGHKSRGQGKPLGRLTVTNKEGESLVRVSEPYKLYRLAEFKLPDEVSLCFTNETQGVVFLIMNINLHHVVHQSELIPNRDETDKMLNKIRKLERDLQEFEDNYKELEKFEERYIGTSSDVITHLTIIGQLLLLAFLIVSWVIRVLMDKTFKYKKVV